VTVNDIIAFAIFVTACGAELKTARTASSNTAGTLFWRCNDWVFPEIGLGAERDKRRRVFGAW
jgi:hypothetical protein